MSARIGLNCALSTPFDEAGGVDLPRMVAHAHWVLAEGCNGLTLFGTTGEGASLSVAERHQMLAALRAHGFQMRDKVMAGVSASSIDEAVEQARTAYRADCRAIMLAPPFYFANASDDGLFAFFSAVFKQLGRDLRDVILYHIPGMTRNGISIALTKRLMAAYPGAILGIKDSNGDWEATQARLRELSSLQILVGDERQLARAVQKGGAGSICGLANVAPDLLAPLANEGNEEPRVNQMVDAVLGYSFMPAIKALIADRLGDPNWRIMRAPLDPLNEAEAKTLAAAIAAIRARKAA